ncbi:DUF58 domain-containing protein [Methylogaea oryzae]|uniref:DUF58 domain-containing protein n=2 Tax=Methylogaea oryzae TaxID=1295382 RepID=A0A8D4VMU2_9GAMM|nr:DUF58 domain-containing protein [Methylogaea oryzae]BBL69469.1 hypothetical protein MoryE10_00750 [Methylogaea oryzae]
MTAAAQTARPPLDGIAVSLEELVALGRFPPPPKARIKARAQQAGGYLSRQKGRGMEFDETRPYVPGDDVRNLDWKVTARSGRAHTKLFREERERPVFVAVDYRPAMWFATRGMYKAVLAARLAALLAWSAQRRGDRIGGQVVAADAIADVKPQHGRATVLQWLQLLAEAPRGPAAEEASFNQALTHLTRHARPGSLVYVLSDFRGLDQAGEAALGRLAVHCQVVLGFVFDPFEQQPPAAGPLRLSDGRREILLPPAAAAIQRQRFEQRREHLQNLARRHNLRLVDCPTTSDPWNLLRHRLL